MGMFDSLYIEYTLPVPEWTGIEFDSSVEFQTKDLECWMNKILLDKEGYLRDADNQKILTIDGDLVWNVVRFYRDFRFPTNNPNYMRTIWLEYKAFFVDSKLEKLDPDVVVRVSYIEIVNSGLSGFIGTKYAHLEDLPADIETPCGPTGDEAFCACGCSGVDERCYIWLAARARKDAQVPEWHTCCKVP